MELSDLVKIGETLGSTALVGVVLVWMLLKKSPSAPGFTAEERLHLESSVVKPIVEKIDELIKAAK